FHTSRASLGVISLIVLMMTLVSAPVQAQNVLTVGSGGAYETIEAALAAANGGDVIEVHGGVYPAPLTVDKSVSLIGIDRPVIDGGGQGSLVLITAPQVLFSGFIVRNSGQSLAHEDTGIIIQAEGVTVRDNLLDNVMFGIYFADAPAGLAEDNVIRGIPLDESMRGDGIRVWYSHDVQLIGNEITGGRDILIWYADNITIRRNHIHHNRYGLHFMFNKNATVQDNIIEHNSVGAYMMYSANLVLTGNQFVDNRGASGYAVAFKDMDSARVQRNIFIGNISALYLDNSPSLYDVNNTIEDNFIAYNDIGLTALPSVQRNIIRRNTFLENYQQISVQGRGDLLRNQWTYEGEGNYWSNYVGYDRDGDGIGDMPFRAEKLFESLTDNEPVLRLFAFSPASQAIDFAASAFPSLRPDPKAIDEAPLMTYTLPAGMTEDSPGVAVPLAVAAFALLGVGGSICAVALRGGVRRQKSAQQPVGVAQGNL
ncbi:MAG: nitrous oxide reductase family maturation protein NosD, partial [Anaerolineae bacterium]|nr:nitrous oxide reductase family maturation protein NosD [Anaerolineae bacterium]